MEKITILNTGCLPSITGPSFTGHIRAEFLQRNGFQVTLVYPYLVSIKEQLQIYNITHTRKTFRNYLRNEYNISSDIRVKLYNVSYNKLFQCQIFINYENLRSVLNNKHILIVEDPEPLLMLSNPDTLISIFNQFAYTVFILHTQYLNISKQTINNKLYRYILNYVDKNIYSKYYDVVYGLYISNALLQEKQIQPNPRHIVSNIHGVNDKYFIDHIQPNNSIYFIGKMDIIHKNLHLMKRCAETANEKITVFGDGKDKEFILSNKQLFNYKGLTNCIDDLREYGIYVSFSYLEGLCTATAEAIAMNKRCIILECDCNNGFRKYKNVYYFNDEYDFVSILQYVKQQPVHIDEHKNDFRWSNCNQQLLKDLLHRIH